MLVEQNSTAEITDFVTVYKPTTLKLQDSCSIIASDKRFLPNENLNLMRDRVAKALAAGEKDKEKWEKEFRWMLEYAYPAGRISANLGAELYKPKVSTINCTVSGTISDSMWSDDGSDILGRVREAGVTLKAGCGIGYDFTTIRPKGAFVSGVGAKTSGVLPFMDIFDSTCNTVRSAGGRRGAQMGCLDICHPDILEFINAKAKKGRLRAFNLSILANQDFINKVCNNEDWKFYFPAFPQELETYEVIYKYWPNREENYTVNEFGETACRVYETIKAADLWETIMKRTFDYSDPGFIVIDEYNRQNPLWWTEWIRATNPCGEQGLPPFGACLLGSINLALFVDDPFTKKASFNFELYEKIIKIFSRALDNIVEVNGLPLKQQRDEIFYKRRHGAGYLGLGSALTMLGIKYGSPDSIEFTDLVTKKLAIESWRAGLELSLEKGAAPILQEYHEITAKMLHIQPKLKTDGYTVGSRIKGSLLHAKYSNYFNKIAEVDPELVEKLAVHGSRYTHCTSLAPTGTMAAGEGNNVSNGIEPSFSHFYIRNMIVPGKKTKESLEMLSYELYAYRELVDKDVDINNPPSEIFDGTTSEVDPYLHIDIQATAQKWIDSSISKTINVPTNYPYENFKQLYLYGIGRGLKGCTTFRYNPEVHQGVLVNHNDIKNTIYNFTMRNGKSINLKGDAKIIYDGQEHTAANLFEAISENNYNSN